MVKTIIKLRTSQELLAKTKTRKSSGPGLFFYGGGDTDTDTCRHTDTSIQRVSMNLNDYFSF